MTKTRQVFCRNKYCSLPRESVYMSSVSKKCGRNTQILKNNVSRVAQSSAHWWTEAPSSTHKTWLSFLLMSRSVFPLGSRSEHRHTLIGRRSLSVKQAANGVPEPHELFTSSVLTNRRAAVAYFYEWLDFIHIFSAINAKCLLKGQLQRNTQAVFLCFLIVWQDIF